MTIAVQTSAQLETSLQFPTSDDLTRKRKRRTLYKDNRGSYKFCYILKLLKFVRSPISYYLYHFNNSILLLIIIIYIIIYIYMGGIAGWSPGELSSEPRWS